MTVTVSHSFNSWVQISTVTVCWLLMSTNTSYDLVKIAPWCKAMENFKCPCKNCFNIQDHVIHLSHGCVPDAYTSSDCEYSHIRPHHTKRRLTRA